MLLRWLREGDRLGLVMFEDLGLELPMRFERNVELGERLQVQITQANPRQDIIRMAEVSAPSQAEAQAEISETAPS
jgi:exoribonuclease-2